MSGPIEAFFELLTGDGAGELPRRASGSLRIDLGSGATTERWFITFGKGGVSVSHRNAKADCVIRTSKEVFARMVSGRMNAMSAILRGVLGIEGDPGILVLFQRIFPGPPKAKSKPKRATRAGSQRT